MKIHFRLKTIEEIKIELSYLGYQVSWLDLTDGDLYLEIGGQRVYIYSKEGMEYYETNDKYINYQIDSFIRELCCVFSGISRGVSKNLYELFNDVTSIRTLNDDAYRWLELYEDDSETVIDTEVENEYGIISDYIYDHRLVAYPIYLVPRLHFFRYNNKLKIIVDCEEKTETGIALWEAKSGVYEINYADFVKEVKHFYNEFIDQMEQQILNAINTDWGHLSIAKNLASIYPQIKKKLLKELEILEQNEKENSEEIERIYQRIQRELVEKSNVK
ncbi:DUF5984 family protein [Phocoenobacter skyensis]|uniref:DUF5984 family protein n=1 Tax=Phocoenobacter skyensis TaxID=97481 RepID=A0A1H7ZY82_9PAST|nr:DUF5984 family protein [Pasteurella skyensis]MDP8080358.1 DUF5984 family protein [Pasteurella skyensis]MDP8086352.1 DUF5984 family protein [Pasteurella skyensis]MDP8171118.1 DUF5984 family protein [Pasteurella skyensis]MDP8173851.1 DUF5984 family protein [Pasteurella skyensis]MDP8186074.1 DUF5984 family protein [Pasteurella skyensis]